jgi:hypothetical protein
VKYKFLQRRTSLRRRRSEESLAHLTRLKKLVAEQALDISILKEAATGNY